MLSLGIISSDNEQPEEISMYIFHLIWLHTDLMFKLYVQS